MNTRKRLKQKLSVVIPAYKAEKFIYKNILGVRNVLRSSSYRYEIICVVDGKIDNTLREAKKAAKKNPRLIRVHGYKKNKGKGHAIRYGMAQASGDIIGFVDAGFELNHKGLSMLLAHFEWYRADIIIGSKRHPASQVVYPWQRRILSRVYQIIVKLLFNINIRDSQVGMKFFRREVVQKVSPRLLVKAFAFDIEMLVVAHYLGYKRIYEAPVELKMKFDGSSTIASTGFVKTAWFMLWDTLAVFYRLKVLDFYNYKNRKSWISSDYLKLKN